MLYLQTPLFTSSGSMVMTLKSMYSPQTAFWYFSLTCTMTYLIFLQGCLIGIKLKYMKLDFWWSKLNISNFTWFKLTFKLNLILTKPWISHPHYQICSISCSPFSINCTTIHQHNQQKSWSYPGSLFSFTIHIQLIAVEVTWLHLSLGNSIVFSGISASILDPTVYTLQTTRVTFMSILLN